MSWRIGSAGRTAGKREVERWVRLPRRQNRAFFVAVTLFLFALPSAALGSPTAFDVTVPGTSNIFGAGVATPPQPGGGGGGMLPILVNLPAGTRRVLALTGASGLINCCSGTTDTPPTGGGSSSNINPYCGLSGFVDNHTVPLVGVFLTDAATSGSGPPTIDWSAHHDDSEVSPLVAQVFYIGNGRTATTNTIQSFHVPDGATRLYLGTADAQGFGGDTGYYVDNTGQWQIQGQIGSQCISQVSLPSGPVAQAIGGGCFQQSGSVSTVAGDVSVNGLVFHRVGSSASISVDSAAQSLTSSGALQLEAVASGSSGLLAGTAIPLVTLAAPAKFDIADAAANGLQFSNLSSAALFGMPLSFGVYGQSSGRRTRRIFPASRV